MAVDVDRLLRRTLNLQRYVTALVLDSEEMMKRGDGALMVAINGFVQDADDRALAALGRQSTSHPDVRRLLADIREILGTQQSTLAAHVASEMGELIDQEVAVTTAAIGRTGPPSIRGVAAMPINGARPEQIIGDDFTKYKRRLMASISELARTDPNAMAGAIRGHRAERYRDGILWWRNNRLLRNDLDLIANGTAGNAANHVYKSFQIEEVDWLATLDFRTCPRCVTAEQNGPYKVGHAPEVPMHPRCRCRLVPHISDDPHERPFVRDSRSVKDIPPDQRAGKIGQTRDTIEAFFGRMTDQQRIDYMGPARARLWREGKITDMRDLVNQSTLEPLRLDQLPD